MKKTDRVAREAEGNVLVAVETAKDWASPKVEAALNWAVPRIEKGIGTAAKDLPQRHHCDSANPRRTDSLAPKIAQAMDEAAPRIQVTLDRATPAITHARDKVVGEYIPSVSARLGATADQVARTLDKTAVPVSVQAAVIKAGGSKRALKKAQKAAAERAKFGRQEAEQSPEGGRRERQTGRRQGAEEAA